MNTLSPVILHLGGNASPVRFVLFLFYTRLQISHFISRIINVEVTECARFLSTRRRIHAYRGFPRTEMRTRVIQGHMAEIAVARLSKLEFDCANRAELVDEREIRVHSRNAFRTRVVAS